MRTLILSDIHLGNRHCALALLREALERERFDRLILNGDTLQSVNLRKLTGPHWAMLDQIRKIGKSRELILVRGNHDHEFEDHPERNGHGLSTRNVLPGLLETPMIEDYPLEVAGKKYVILHGDRFDPTLNYALLTDVACFAYQVTTKINKKLAKWLKKKSKKWGGLLEFVRLQSIGWAQKQGLAGIVMGHTHFCEDALVDDVHYLNSGCWTEFPCSYLTVDNDKFELHHMAD